MASTQITYKPISSEITSADVPDYSKLGSVFSSAVEGVGTAGRQVVDNNISQAENVLRTSVQNAKSLEEANSITTDDLVVAGADAAQLKTANDLLKGRKTDLFSNELITNYDQQVAQNNLLSRDILKREKDLQDVISIDAGGNPLFAEATGETEAEKAKNQLRIDEATKLFQQRLKEAGASPIRNDRDRAAFLREQTKSFNATPEQQAAIEQRLKAHITKTQAISVEEQRIIAGEHKQTDNQVQLQKINLAQEKQNLINELGIDPESANKLKQTTWGNIWDTVNNLSGENLSWLGDAWNKSTGSEANAQLKEKIYDEFHNAKTKAGNAIEPWMVVEGIKGTMSNDPDGTSSIDFDWLGSSFFQKYVTDLADGKRNSLLDRAAQIPFEYQRKETELDAKAEQLKVEQARLLRGSFGIKDTDRFRRLLNQDLATNEEAVSSNQEVEEQKQRLAGQQEKVDSVATQPENIPLIAGSGPVVSSGPSTKFKQQYGNNPDIDVNSAKVRAKPVGERPSGTAGQVAVVPGGAGVRDFKPRVVFDMTPEDITNLNHNSIKEKFKGIDLEQIRNPHSRQYIANALDTNNPVNWMQRNTATDIKHFFMDMFSPFVKALSFNNRVVVSPEEQRANRELQQEALKARNLSPTERQGINRQLQTINQEALQAEISGDTRKQELLGEVRKVLQKRLSGTSLEVALNSFVESDYYKKHEASSTKFGEGGKTAKDFQYLRDILLQR